MTGWVTVVGGESFTILTGKPSDAEYLLVDGRGGDETTIQFDGVHIGDYSIQLWRDARGGSRVTTGSVERSSVDPEVVDELEAIRERKGGAILA